MWELHQIGKTYGQRPSVILGLSHLRFAMAVDRTILAFGTDVEVKLQQYHKDGRPKHTLEKLLGLEPTGSFGSLASRARKVTP